MFFIENQMHASQLFWKPKWVFVSFKWGRFGIQKGRLLWTCWATVGSPDQCTGKELL